MKVSGWIAWVSLFVPVTVSALPCADVGYVTWYKHLEWRVTTWTVDPKCEFLAYEEKRDGKLHETGKFAIDGNWTCQAYSPTSGKCQHRYRRYWNADKSKMTYEREVFESGTLGGGKYESEETLSYTLEQNQHEVVRRSFEKRRVRNDRTRWNWTETTKADIEFLGKQQPSLP